MYRVQQCSVPESSVAIFTVVRYHYTCVVATHKVIAAT